MSDVTLTFHIDQSELDQLGDRGKRAVDRAIELIATEVWGNIAREAPIDTGRLAGSWKLSRIGPMSYSIATNVIYASYVHEGTSPHTIVPVNKAALWWPGAPHPVKKVNHPGTEGNPFASRAI